MTLDLVVADSMAWLPLNRNQGTIVTSLPDMDELGWENIHRYVGWFRSASALCFGSTSEGCPTVFYQTDRKKDGALFSKAFHLMDVAKFCGRNLLLHKIVLRRDVGKVDLHRPGYTHLLVFGDSSCKPGKATPDVIHAGEMLYPNAMGTGAVTVALDVAVRASQRVLDPFCGMGSVPIAAARRGMKATGIDIVPDMILKAKSYAEI
jgi:hypothetical protein